MYTHILVTGTIVKRDNKKYTARAAIPSCYSMPESGFVPLNLGNLEKYPF